MLEDLIADIPSGVVLSGLCPLPYLGFFVLGFGMIEEAQFDLDVEAGTLSSFSSCVSSFSKFLGTETEIFHCFFLSPRWSGSMKLLISSLIVRAWGGMSSFEKNCYYLS